MVQTMNGMEVPVQLLSSGDGAVRDMGRDGLKRLISSTVDAMATVDGDGNPLIAPKDVAMFLQRFNGNVRQGSMAGWLARCRTVDDVDRVVTMVASGKLVVPQYSVDPSSRNVEERYDALNISDSTGGEGEYMRSMVEKRKFDIVRDGVTARQLAVLRDTTDHTMVRGTTQPSADAWFMDYRDVISDTVGRGEDPKPIIQYLASRMDRVPSQVVATIRGAVASGDNAAIQVAAPYLMAWHDENPAALARAFQDDGMTLISMFSLANQLSTASTTQTGVRERTLKSFSFQTRGREDQQSSYDRLISDHVDDSMLTNLVASWENNREIRKDFGTPGDFQDVEETSLSPFFLAALRDQFRGYLEDSGGDLAAATRMMESAISTIGVSRLGTVPSPSMPYCPENYPGVADRESIAHAIESMGKKWYNDAMANGDMPDGSEYVGTFLLSDDITARQAEDIDFSLSRGIDHMVSDEGKKIFCPSYAQMITFSFGGLVHFIPVGRFNPSLHIPDGQKTKEPGGAS
jgi:hypothetical protein